MRVRRPTDVRRREFIEAARVVITDHGMQALTIGSLARAVGVSEGAIYRHFKGKKQIIAGLIEDIDLRLNRRIDLIDGDPDAGLRRLEEVLKDNVAPSTVTGVSFMVIAEVLMNGDAELRRLMQTAIDRHLSMIEAQLSVGVHKEEVRKDIDLKAASVQFYGLIQAVNTLNHFGDEDYPVGESSSLWSIFRNGVSTEQA
ncbi:MAG: TetR/AcrR family transcriptional regulator [Dehalococcoidia bacterium]|nr:TetR/AcrR family transcriptional regulator [Dehalococcoidia bacterium]